MSSVTVARPCKTTLTGGYLEAANTDRQDHSTVSASAARSRNFHIPRTPVPVPRVVQVARADMPRTINIEAIEHTANQTPVHETILRGDLDTAQNPPHQRHS